MNTQRRSISSVQVGQSYFDLNLSTNKEVLFTRVPSFEEGVVKLKNHETNATKRVSAKNFKNWTFKVRVLS